MNWKLLICLISITSLSANAFPPFLKEYASHPQAKEELKQSCGLCHIAPGGGGERNDFGHAFAAEGAAITKELIEKFPQNFNPAQ